MSAPVCTSCGMTGGAEFFTQEKPLNDCKKDYGGCIYSAQGTIVCNLRKPEPLAGPQYAEGFTQAIEYTPGMSLGGLPNFASLPNGHALEEFTNSGR